MKRAVRWICSGVALIAAAFFLPGLLPWRGDDALLQAASTGDTDTIERALAAGLDPNRRIPSNRGWGHRVLMSASPEPEATTPLLLSAAEAQQFEMVELLLLHGADPNGGDGAGNTPLRAAAHQNDLPTSLLLLSHGADPRALWKDGSGIEEDCPSPAREIVWIAQGVA